jgi:hypothetical protein
MPAGGRQQAERSRRAALARRLDSEGGNSAVVHVAPQLVGHIRFAHQSSGHIHVHITITLHPPQPRSDLDLISSSAVQIDYPCLGNTE